MEVRPAWDTELDAIAEMQDAHWAEKKDKVNALPYDSSFAKANLLEFYKSKDDLFLVALTGDREVAGYMWVRLVQPHYSPCTFYATELYLYVKPQYRNGRAAKMLIEQAIRCSKQCGAHHLELGEMSGNVRLEAAYEKRFTRIGTLFQVTL